MALKFWLDSICTMCNIIVIIGLIPFAHMHV